MLLKIGIKSDFREHFLFGVLIRDKKGFLKSNNSQTDTLTAISGRIAEAFLGILDNFIEE